MKTLIVRFSSAGDVLLTSLFVRCLRRRFPTGQIEFLTKESFAPLVETNPHLDRVRTIPDDLNLRGHLKLRRLLSAESFDAVFDLHGSLRSRLLTTAIARDVNRMRKVSFRRWLLIRFKINLLRPVRPVPERYLDVGKKYGLLNDGYGLELVPPPTAFPVTVPDSYVCIAPGARHATKRWPVDRFADAIDALYADAGTISVLVGDEADGPVGQLICNDVRRPESVENMIGRTDLAQLTTVVERASLVVANDSAVGHIAAALNVPVISIFGPTVREFGFAPYARASTVVERTDLACRPCSKHGTETCPKGHFRCMLEIQSDEVLKASRDMMESTEATHPPESRPA